MGDYLDIYPQKKCRSRSEFGACGLPMGHDYLHAVPLGDDVWFGYTRNRPAQPFGYMELKFSGWERL